MKTIKIGNRFIGEGHPCFVIAEIGVNHNGNIYLAKQLIVMAKKAGADAVKFQIYKTDKFVSKNTPTLEYQKKQGYMNQYDMLKSFELTYNEFRDLAKFTSSRNMIFLATPHSCNEDVDLAAELCPAIKIGSGSIRNYSLLKHIARKKLPMFLSTGMSTLAEIKKAYLTLNAREDIVLLHCTSEYPCPLEHINLNNLDTLKNFTHNETIIGLSDHSRSVMVPALAVSKGAHIIEKHFTYDKNEQGPDHHMSLNFKEFRQMVQNIRDAEKALGSPIKKPTIGELTIKNVTQKRGMKYAKKTRKYTI